MEDIRRRVVTDAVNGDLLLEETFLQPDPKKNWLMPIPGGGPGRKLRDIKVTLWYVDPGICPVDPRLPPPNPYELMQPPTESETRSTRPFMDEGSVQRKKDLKAAHVEVPEGQTMGTIFRRRRLRG